MFKFEGSAMLWISLLVLNFSTKSKYIICMFWDMEDAWKQKCKNKLSLRIVKNVQCENVYFHYYTI